MSDVLRSFKGGRMLDSGTPRLSNFTVCIFLQVVRKDLACRTTQIALCFQNQEDAGREDKLELSNVVYLCWDERVAEDCISGDLGEGVEGITIVEVDVGDKAYCEFHYDSESEALQEADLLFRQGQFYARFRYWGAPLRGMSEAGVLAFLLPLAENVCGRMT